MNLMSPRKGQDFIWLAEYLDGSYLTEFDLGDGKENSFYSINKSMLVRFGLIGHNLKMFYEVLGGYFNIAGTFIEIILKEKDGKEYPITGRQEIYNDIITFKDAEAYIDSTSISGNITKYNFGFKKSLVYSDLCISSKVIFTIPYKKLSYFNFRLVCDRDITGELIIKYSGKVVEALPCEFVSERGYELNWIMK